MFLEDFAGRVLPFDSVCTADYAAVVATRRAHHVGKAIGRVIHARILERQTIGQDIGL